LSFWDSSAILPLFIHEPRSAAIRACFSATMHILWWSTPLECESALCRRLREGSLSAQEATDARRELLALRTGMIEIAPSEEVRALATDLLRRHALRAADAAQLGAAGLYRRRTGQALEFVCLDERLRDAARLEGFAVLP
jgi:predicted nucleic acid-binding protein